MRQGGSRRHLPTFGLLLHPNAAVLELGATLYPSLVHPWIPLSRFDGRLARSIIFLWRLGSLKRGNAGYKSDIKSKHEAFGITVNCQFRTDSSQFLTTFDPFFFAIIRPQHTAMRASIIRVVSVVGLGLNHMATARTLPAGSWYYPLGEKCEAA